LQYSRTNGANGMATYSYAGLRANETICESPPQDPWSTDHAWWNYIKTNLFTSVVPTPDMPWRNPATATEGTVWGRVWDHATGLPVDDLTVAVSGSGRPGELTDANGYYTVTLVPATASGTSYTISANKWGFPATSHPAAIIRAGDVVRYDFSLGAPPPQMEVSPSSIVRLITVGKTAADDSFTVTNLGGGTLAPLNYNITTNAAWLSVTPFNGSSNGEPHAISVSYNTSGLGMGSHNAVIMVSDAAAVNHPQTVSVTLNLAPPGDFDGDMDVDQDDFAFFQRCMSGDFNAHPPGCEHADLDGDGDVDDTDFNLFFNCMSGPGIIGNPDCLD
jgi:hypothetical protein